MAGYDGEAIWGEDCAGTGQERASGEGAEAVGRGLDEADGVAFDAYRLCLEMAESGRESSGRIVKEQR